MGIRVVVADDEDYMREAIESLLAAEADVEVVGVATDAAGALELTEAQHPDVLVMDLSMPGELDAFDATRAVRERMPSVHVVAFSGHIAQGITREALAAGVIGFVAKDRAIEDLIPAIRLATDGRPFLSDVIVRTLIAR